MSAVLDRLSPRDIYVRLDRLRDNWHDVDNLTEPDSSEARYADTRREAALDLHERKIALQLRDLGKLLDHLPARFYDRAMVEYEEIKRGRISESADWAGAISRLAKIVSDWDSSRPPLLPCPQCGVELRGRENVKAHLLTVHQLEEGS